MSKTEYLEASQVAAKARTKTAKPISIERAIHYMRKFREHLPSKKIKYKTSDNYRDVFPPHAATLLAKYIDHHHETLEENQPDYLPTPEEIWSQAEEIRRKSPRRKVGEIDNDWSPPSIKWLGQTH